jgi:hypothetical protein
MFKLGQQVIAEISDWLNHTISSLYFTASSCLYFFYRPLMFLTDYNRGLLKINCYTSGIILVM